MIYAVTHPRLIINQVSASPDENCRSYPEMKKKKKTNTDGQMEAEGYNIIHRVFFCFFFWGGGGLFSFF